MSCVLAARVVGIRHSLRCRRALPLAVGLLALAPAAHADEPTVTGGQHVPLTWTPLPPAVPLFGGEPTDAGDGLPASIAILPLRLSLLDASFPITMQWGLPRGGDPMASAAPAFPVQRHVILPLTPRLTLHGFTSGRIASDTGVGGAVTYTAPLARNMWLVGSAGVYGVQAFRANQPASLTAVTDTRLDLVLRPVWSVGVGQRGVSFAGAW